MSGKYEKSILEMTSKEARAYFLKSNSYFSGNLPSYFDFTDILKKVTDLLGKHNLNEFWYRKPSSVSNVNRKILMNKDGKYAWRQLQIIHPFIYVDLVNIITDHENWEIIQKNFSEFDNTSNDSKIRCISIPKQSKSKISDTGNTILGWWKNSEQAMIKYALDYEYCLQTDITDCYPSMNTHSIFWALHGENHVKKNDKTLLGNRIDESIQYMQNMQTTGLPQGSVLMDFIAEIILGYSDKLLRKKLDIEGINSDFQIIRFRDDYKIFSNSKEEVERILKALSTVLYDLNLRLNSSKTYLYNDVILDGIKLDKLYWTTKYESFVNYFPLKETIVEFKNNEIPEDEDDQFDNSLDNKYEMKPFYKISIQKHLLQIKILGDKFPNCGQLKKALTDLYKYRILAMKKPTDIDQLVSILVSIMLKNPTTIQHCTVILGRILDFYKEDPNRIYEIIEKIRRKYNKLPNTDLVEIWLQRFTDLLGEQSHDFKYKSEICTFVDENPESFFWNSEWLKKDWLITDSWRVNSYIRKKLTLITAEEEINAFSFDSSEEEESSIE